MAVTFGWHSHSAKEIAPIKIAYTEPEIKTILSRHFDAVFKSIPPEQEIIVVCVGTDRSTGDSLGPLVGSQLKRSAVPRLPLFGTLDEPVHAMNLQETLQNIHHEYQNPFIVAIDACLGQLSSVGHIQIGNGPVKPGAGVNKDLPAVGDIHVTGIVNVGGFMEYFVLQNTRLNLVFQMADIISQCLYTALMNTRNLRHFRT